MDHLQKLEAKDRARLAKTSPAAIDWWMSFLRDSLFVSIAFTTSLLSGTLFWSVFCVDPALVVPEHMVGYLATRVVENHALHTVPIVVCLLDSLIVFRRRVERPFGCLLVALSWTTGYLGWLAWVHNQTNDWTYPLLARMAKEKSLLIIFIASCYVGTVMCYLFVLRIINVWKNGHLPPPRSPSRLQFNKQTSVSEGYASAGSSCAGSVNGGDDSQYVFHHDGGYNNGINGAIPASTNNGQQQGYQQVGNKSYMAGGYHTATVGGYNQGYSTYGNQDNAYGYYETEYGYDSQKQN